MAVGTTTAIILGGAALGATSGAVQGIAAKKQANTQIDLLDQQAGFAAAERQRQADDLQKRQKVSYLKSGVLLTGSPLRIMEETDKYAQADKRQIFSQASIQSSNLSSAANTGIFKSLFGGMAQGAMAGYNLSGTFGGGNPKPNPIPKTPAPKKPAV